MKIVRVKHLHSRILFIFFTISFAVDLRLELIILVKVLGSYGLMMCNVLATSLGLRIVSMMAGEITTATIVRMSASDAWIVCI